MPVPNTSCTCLCRAQEERAEEEKTTADVADDRAPGSDNPGDFSSGKVCTAVRALDDARWPETTAVGPRARLANAT